MKKTNTFLKRFLALALAVLTLFSMVPFIEGQEADAASVNAVKTTIVNAKTGAIQVFCPNVKITVYRDVNLSCYQGWVKAEDIKITGMSNTALKISYYSTATKGTRTGYISFTSIFPSTSYSCWRFNATKTINVYCMSNGTTKYGAITYGDKNCLVVGEYLGKYIVIYPVTGKKYSKMGLVSKGDISCYAPYSYTAKTMTNALYGINTSKSYITCGFDGYVNTRGRHEGIDFKRGNGYAVYSLTNGVITRVTQGSRGSNGLSTIAIYDSSTNKTVVYLHSDPLDSLYVGQRISVGQKIAVEDWRGCSTSGGGHTHVEVRDGRKTSAAKSVNDYRLDNTNPSSFWQSKGYTVK